MDDHKRESRIVGVLSGQVKAGTNQVRAAIALMDEGATVPFIARYRKEATGGLTDEQLRLLHKGLSYQRDLEARRQLILEKIDEQGKLSEELKCKIAQAETRTMLEDLYLPYKTKRRTKAQIAREAGLAPLAGKLWRQPHLDPQTTANGFVNPAKGIGNATQALDGAAQILAEKFAEDAEIRGHLRKELWQRGRLRSRVLASKREEGSRFSDYFDHQEPMRNMPSHRVLAVMRGKKLGFLKLDLLPAPAPGHVDHHETYAEWQLAKQVRIRDSGRPADGWLLQVLRSAWKEKLLPQLTTELFKQLRERAEAEAIDVFAVNLRDLLLAAPAGAVVTMGLDPGFRTGVKLAVVDDTGKLLSHGAIYPHAPKRREKEALDRLHQECKRHRVGLIAIGNGTASRETDQLVGKLIKKHPELELVKAMVSEAGASVYSASPLAAAEFPQLDVSIRGAVSIARRLQDPLAELVKVEPKSIGVGQYQHDVDQTALSHSLDGVVEDAVNGIGVDVNTASQSLLTHVSGIGKVLAENLVAWRDANGRFEDRQQLKKVPRMGAKAFEQSAGFLRIFNGRQPLDSSAVHPEAYSLANQIAIRCSATIPQILDNPAVLKTLDPGQFTSQQFGLPTVRDVFGELEKPGRDPRGSFTAVRFREGVETMEDLEVGMALEGVVSNVANFGAFVDVGVHQDGLVHISELADGFVQDPRSVVKVGDRVKVRVLSVDLNRKRIGLSMREP